MWNGTLAFARVYPRLPGLRGRVPYLYFRGVNDQHSLRLPGGSRGADGLPGPVALDLAGRRLAFGWEYTRSTLPVSELRLDTIGGDHRRIAADESTEMVRRTFTSPTIAEGRVFSAEIFQGALRNARFLRSLISSRALSTAPAPKLLTSTTSDPFDRGRIAYVQGQGGLQAQDACQPEPKIPTQCLVARTAGDVPFG